MKYILIISLLSLSMQGLADSCGNEQCFKANLDDIKKYKWDTKITSDIQKLNFRAQVKKRFNWLDYKCATAPFGSKYWAKSVGKEIPAHKNKVLEMTNQVAIDLNVRTSYELLTEKEGFNIQIDREVIIPKLFPSKIQVKDGGTSTSLMSINDISYAFEHKMLTEFVLENRSKAKVYSNSYKLFGRRQMMIPLKPTASKSFDLGSLFAWDSVFFFIDTTVEGFSSEYWCLDANIMRPYQVAEQVIYANNRLPVLNYKKEYDLRIEKKTPLKFFFNFNQSKLYVKVGGEVIVAFDRANQVSQTGFSTDIKDETNILKDFLVFLQKRMRPSIFQRTYGDISKSIFSLNTLVKNGGTVLHDDVKQEFEAAYFMAIKIMSKDIEKDRIVESYGMAVNGMIEHLKYINKVFFQFNPEEPGVKIIKLTSKTIQQQSERALKVLSLETQNLEIKKSVSVLNKMIDMTEDLIVMDPLGSLNDETLTILYDLLDYYEGNFKQMEKDLIDYNVESELSQMKSVFDLLIKITE